MAHKRKIYLINLWLYNEDVEVEIHEYTVKRKGKESIQTEEGEELYSYKLDKPISGLIVGESTINVSMLTEDFFNINKAIQKMIDEGRKRVDLEVSYFKEMYKQLELLKNYEKSCFIWY